MPGHERANPIWEPWKGEKEELHTIRVSAVVSVRCGEPGLVAQQ